MISFKYNEIPQGKSSQTLDVKPSDISIDDLDIRKVHLDVHFNKSDNSTIVDIEVKTGVQFTCDRSLEVFDQTLSGNFTVVFKPGLSEDQETKDGTFRAIDTEGEKMDITNEVRDTILLSIPIKRLHPRFLTESGEPTEFFENYSDGETADPRWDALKKLKNN